MTDPAACVLASVERRLLSLAAYEALWHLQRLDEWERGRLVEREVHAPGGSHAVRAEVAA